jgi:hypothetical protein
MVWYEKFKLKVMSSKKVYWWLFVTSLIIFVLEIRELFHGHGHAMIMMDLGHVFAHLFVAIIALIFLNSHRNLEKLRLWFLLLIILGTIISLIFSLFAPHGHDHIHHPWILVTIGIISFFQHVVTSRHHDHSRGHDLLCSGIKWHFAADAVKSICFALIGFGLSSNTLTVVAYLATIIGVIMMTQIVYQEIKK